MDRALLPCSPHTLLFAKVEYYLPLCLITWGCSLPEPCPALQHSVSCCSTWGQLLTSPAQYLVPYTGQGCGVQAGFLLLCKHVTPCQGWVNKGISELLWEIIWMSSSFPAGPGAKGQQAFWIFQLYSASITLVAGPGL